MTMKISMKQLVSSMVLAAAFFCLPFLTQASQASADPSGSMNSAMLTKNASAQGDKTSKSAGAIPDKSPTQAIKDLDSKFDEFKTGKNLTPEQESHNRQLKMEIIHGTFDISELSRLALAKHWNGLSEAKRKNFVDLMIALLEEKALFSKEQSAAKSKEGGKYKVVYKGHEFIAGEKDKAFVRTKVLIPSENIDINLNYKLKAKDGEWKIYDVIVDEASLVSNYKYQFNSIITKHGYDELVNRMSKKLDEIRTDRNKKT